MDDTSQTNHQPEEDSSDTVAPEQEDDVAEQEEQEEEPGDNTLPPEDEKGEDKEAEPASFKPAIQPSKNPKSAVGAMMFSLCLMGGAGHIYLGQKRKGIFIIILALLASCVGLDFPILIIAAIDAFVIARRLEQRRPVGLWECWWNRRKPHLPPFPEEEEGEEEDAET